jgi:hypothetical protein
MMSAGSQGDSMRTISTAVASAVFGAALFAGGNSIAGESVLWETARVSVAS